MNSLTETMNLVITEQGEAAVRCLSGAAIACYQFLAKDDPTTLQAIKYTTRIIDVLKKVPAISSLKSAFELSITKMKRPDRLERTDFVQGELPPCLHPEFDDIRLKNEEVSDAELWNTDSLCFRYFNILH